MDERPAIRLYDIVAEYPTVSGPVRALHGIDLEIARGESLCIIGASGSGKTTLLDILGTLLRPAQGSYRAGETDLTVLSPKMLAAYRNSQIGFVFQAFNLLDHIDVRNNILLPLQYGPNGSVDEAAELDRLLERLDLVHLAGRKPQQLSGGQRQRVAIARALIRNPSLVLADEPTGSLDSATAGEVMQLLADSAEPDRSLVVVTHDQAIADHFERVVELRDGRIVGGRN